MSRKIPARIQIYNPTGPQGTGYIIGDRAGLRQLSEALKSAATGPMGVETAEVYSADGHEYTVMICSDISEDEWQRVEPNYAKQSSPVTETIKNYQELLNLTKK